MLMTTIDPTSKYEREVLQGSNISHLKYIVVKRQTERGVYSIHSAYIINVEYLVYCSVLNHAYNIVDAFYGIGSHLAGMHRAWARLGDNRCLEGKPPGAHTLHVLSQEAVRGGHTELALELLGRYNDILQWSEPALIMSLMMVGSSGRFDIFSALRE